MMTLELVRTGPLPEQARPPLLTVKEVARRLAASTTFVYAAVQKRQIGSHKCGRGQGCIRISEAQYAEYLTTTERKRLEAPEKGALASPAEVPKKRFRYLT